MQFSNQKIINCYKQLSLVLLLFYIFSPLFTLSFAENKLGFYELKDSKLEIKKSNSVIFIDLFETTDDLEEDDKDELDFDFDNNYCAFLLENTQIYYKKPLIGCYFKRITTEKHPLYLIYCSLKIAMM